MREAQPLEPKAAKPKAQSHDSSFEWLTADLLTTGHRRPGAGNLSFVTSHRVSQ